MFLSQSLVLMAQVRRAIRQHLVRSVRMGLIARHQVWRVQVDVRKPAKVAQDRRRVRIRLAVVVFRLRSKIFL